MNLRTRIILACSLFLALEVGLFFAFFRWNLSPKIYHLEESYLENDLSRNMALIQRELFHLERTSELLVLLESIQHPNPDNIVPLMTEQDLNLLYIVDNNNLVLFGKIIDLNSMIPYPNQNFLSSLWKEKPLFLKATADGHAQMGIYNSFFGPMLLVSTTIIRENIPVGILVTGKLMSSDMIQLMHNITFTALSVWPLEGASLSKKHLEILNALSESGANFFVEKNKYTLQGYVSLTDMNQINDILLSTTHSRDVQNIIKNNGLFLFSLFLLIQILFMGFIYWIITRRANRPLHALIQELDTHQDSIETITFSNQSWGELDPLVQSLSNFISHSQQHVNKQNILAYQQGLYFADQTLYQDLETFFSPLIEGLEDLEHEWLSLPTDNLEWLLAECRARNIQESEDPFQKACFQKLSGIQENMHQIQKQSYQKTLKLHHEALRGIMLVRRRVKRLTPSFDFPRMTRS